MRKMIRNKFLLCSALTAVGLAAGGTANAQNLNVLWYGSSGYNTGIDALSTPGTGDPSTTTWTITNDNTTTAPGAAISTFNAVIVGSDQPVGFLTAAMLGDRILMTGQDADYHLNISPGPANFDGPRGFLRDAVNWAGAGTGTGFVFLDPSPATLAALGITGLGTLGGADDTVNIPSAYSAYPINTGLTSAGISHWSTASHESWTGTDTTQWTGINTNSSGGYVTIVSAATAGGGAAGVSTPPVGGSNDIDTSASHFSSSNLGTTVNPVFQGGTLDVAASGTIANAFTVNSAGGTIDSVGNNAVFSGVFSGTGGVTVGDSVGGGSVTLTNANTYSGQTAIVAGAKLALAASGSIAASEVTANGTLDISATNAGASVQGLNGTGAVQLGGQTLTVTSANDLFSGVIAGAGGLAVGGGTQALTGANTYTGPTTVAQTAALYIGYQSAGGSVAGDIVNNGTVVFDRTTASSYGGAISGNGVVRVDGQSSVVLTGTNTYAGGTVIAAGTTLQVGAGGTSGSIGAGDVVDTGALVFNRSDVITVSAVIGGAGTLTQAGLGTLVLNGVNTVTGQTTVSSGVLEVGDAANPGAKLGGDVVVGASGALRGHGSIVGAVNNTAGGVVAPGGSIGTLTVGSYAQGANGTLAIEVSPKAASQLNVLGAASLNGKLALTFDPGAYTAHVYQIVAGAPVSGTFSAVTQTGASSDLAYGLSYGGKQVDLVVESAAGAQVYGGVTTASLDRAQGFASMVESRFGDAGCADGSGDKGADRCGGRGAWVQVLATDDHIASSGARAGFSNTGAGIVGGIDRGWNNLTGGAAFGYEQDVMSMGSVSAKGASSFYYGALYGRWAAGSAWLDGQAFYMHGDWSVTRNVVGFGAAKSNPDGNAYGFLVQASAPVGNDLRPYVRLTYTQFDRSDVTESGVGALDYVVGSGSTNSAVAEAGVMWSHSYAAWNGTVLRPALQIGGQDQFGDLSRNVGGGLQGVAGPGFDVASARVQPGAGVVDASLKTVVSKRFELTADLRGRFSNGQSDASASVGGVFRF
jgi:fibronectin-binding autotransporter adhesin